MSAFVGPLIPLFWTSVYKRLFLTLIVNNDSGGFRIFQWGQPPQGKGANFLLAIFYRKLHENNGLRRIARHSDLLQSQ